MADRPLLTDEDQQQLADLIAACEHQTSAEIKIFLEPWCWGDPLRRARQKFKELHLHRTRLRNGLLLYVAYQSHRFAVVGDEGLCQKLPPQFWEHLRDELIELFRKFPLAEALGHAIRRCGRELSHYFPAVSPNPNELSNTIEFAQ
ncbi:MAG: TPM domain-containing protein [Chitinophagales bacterium]|nr:TPM domain-containing protein [Chitinophagales bacterium]MDW8427227.1 TPM domain-containing protein [Chitinophagales bacterium]